MFELKKPIDFPKFRSIGFINHRKRQGASALPFFIAPATILVDSLIS